MGGIERAVVVQMRTKANELRDKGTMINSFVCSAYENVGKMFSAWKGTQYNNLVQSLINIKPNFDEMLRCVVKDIPDAVQGVAENYSSIEMATRQDINTRAIKQIEDLAIQDDTVFRFMIEDVESYRKIIFQELNDSMKNIDEFQEVMDSVDWDADSSNKDRPTFMRLKEQIREQIASFQASFSQFVVELTERIITAENNNTI